MRVDIRILVLIWGGKHSAFHYYVWYQLLIFLHLFYICSTRLKTLTCIPSLLRLFNQEGVFNSVKCFLCSYRDDHMTWFLVSWNQSWIIIGRTDPTAEVPILWPPDWCKELTHWKRPWCWERLRARGQGDDRGWDGLMASRTQWVWANSEREWRTRKAWHAAVHGVTKNRTGLSDWTTNRCGKL